LLLLLFPLYLSAVFSAVGTPTLYYHPVEPVLNLIPFADFLSSPGGWLKNFFLNILLFLPLGFLLPLLWTSFSGLRRTVLFGFSLSLFIELSQLFVLRATDTDDLIANTLGALIGFALFRLLAGRRPGLLQWQDGPGCGEALFLTALALVSRFFLSPLLSDLLWLAVL